MGHIEHVKHAHKFKVQVPGVIREGPTELHHVIPLGFLSAPVLKMMYDLSVHQDHRTAEKVAHHLAHIGVDVGIHALIEAAVHVLEIVGPVALVATGEGVVVVVTSKMIFALGKLIVSVRKNLAAPTLESLVAVTRTVDVNVDVDDDMVSLFKLLLLTE